MVPKVSWRSAARLVLGLAGPDRVPYPSAMRILAAVGVGGIAAGLLVLPASLTFEPLAAARAIASQLPVTGTAALAVAITAALNLAAGSVLTSLFTSDRVDRVTDLILASFAAAVLFDVAMLYVLGWLGIFDWGPLLLLHAIVLIAGWRKRLGVFAARRMRRRNLSPIWAIIAIGWSAPMMLQLASPIVPWPDVLPNHVAPVEHVRAFASFDPLTTSPAPTYGPSRVFLGYVALQSVNAVVVDMPASLVVTAYVAVEMVLVGIAVYRLAELTGGRRSAPWALIAFMLTHPFARLADDRARVLALPLALYTLILVVRVVSQRQSNGTSRGTSNAPAGAVALGATILVHPVIGALTAVAVIIVAALGPRTAPHGALGFLAGAFMLALPQGLVMVGYPVPSVAGVASLPLGLAIPRWVPMDYRRLRRLLWFMALGVLVITLANGVRSIGAPVEWLTELVRFSPLLAALSLIGAFVAPSRVLHPAVVGGLLASAAFGIYARSIPPDVPSLILRSLQFELQKEVIAWAPVFLALAAARAIVEVLKIRASHPRWSYPVRVALIASFLLVAGLPVRPRAIDSSKVGELRFSENLAISLGRAERGFWQGYPDARRLIDRHQQELVDVVASLVRSGHFGRRSEVLHVARSYQPWGGTPLAVLAGVNETTVSPDAEGTNAPLDSIHTVGGRLYPLSNLDALLADARFPLVLVEPEGLPTWIGPRVDGAGYDMMFSNERGTLFRLEGWPGDHKVSNQRQP